MAIFMEWALTKVADTLLFQIHEIAYHILYLRHFENPVYRLAPDLTHIQSRKAYDFYASSYISIQRYLPELWPLLQQSQSSL